MELNEIDLTKFYQLYLHIDIKSPYIGIIGSKTKFNNYMKSVLTEYKPPQYIIRKNAEGTVYRIYNEEGIEHNYVYIKDIDDLTDYRFNKYV